MKAKTMAKEQKVVHELPRRFEADIASSKIFPPVDETYATFYHAVNPGDLIAAMGSIKKYYDITKRRVTIYQNTNQAAQYYPGASHPTVNSEGINVCCNDYMLSMLKPLIESQEYIRSLEKYDGQRVDIDLHIIRGKTFINLPNGAIQTWISFAYPDLAFDMSKAWIILNEEDKYKELKVQMNGKVMLNFTERYRNTEMDYFFLQNYAPDLIFAGTEKEHWLFTNKWQLNMPRLEIRDFLELAYAIKYSRFLIANQSMCWNLADAIKHPRILEVCRYAQNCIHMVGEDSHGFFHQPALEYYFRMMYNKTFKK